MPQPTSNFPTGRSKGRGSLLFLILLLVLMGMAVANRQNLQDWAQLRDYDAPAAISQLADQDTMTDYGRKIFYVNHPDIQDKEAFFSNCPNSGAEKTIVLGCYHGNQRGIYLLDVTDPRLNGVIQVTAAHEMLHGAYDRLSSSERRKIDALLQKYYREGLKDPRIQATIEAYKQSEPNDLVNEMHSIFATEVSSLPSELEEYYRRYFTNRSQVVASAARYQAEFTSRKTAVAQYDARLAPLKTELEAGVAELKTRYSDIIAQQARLVQLRDSGNIATYNAGVAPFNAQIDNYNTRAQSIEALKVQYNQLVQARNAIAFEEDELMKALSSPTTPAKQ